MTGFVSDLILWYKENERDLPWRKTKDVYRIWVSEIILQQTRVNQGLSYYINFVEQFPTVHHLANASEDTVLKCWEGLGYYSRARNMHHTAKYVSQELNGTFPESYDGLLKLKGIGSYTAAAISSICYNEHRTVVDGNVFRVLSRVYGIETPINTGAGKRKIEELAHTLNDGKDKGAFNQALMEFGALQCSHRLPNCAACIFNQHCRALKYKKVDLLPIKEKKLKIKHRYMFYFLIKNPHKQTIIQRRNQNDIWKGLYQFPLIETAKNISVRGVLASDDFERLINKQQVRITSETLIKHQLTHQTLHLSILCIQLNSIDHFSEPEFKVINVDKINDYAFPKPLSGIN